MILVGFPVLKYILIGLITGVLLKYIPALNLSDENIIRVVALSIVVNIFYDIFIKNKFGMEQFEANEDPLNLQYDQFDKPQLANGIPYEEAPSLITASKLHDIYEQNQFGTDFSQPELDKGKDRGYLNWDKLY